MTTASTIVSSCCLTAAVCLLRLHPTDAFIPILSRPPPVLARREPLAASVPPPAAASSTSSTKTTTSAASSSSSPCSSWSNGSPSSSSMHLPLSAMDDLDRHGYAVIHDFLSPSLVQELQQDVSTLRSLSQFKIAKIGQDATNTLNTEIRVAETCFLGRSKEKRPDDHTSMPPSPARDQLYDALDAVRIQLSSSPGKTTRLDENLTELLYAYYPRGGFYRRHRDAVPGSASILREYSLLLYLNPDWKPSDGGHLRLHLDGGDDFLPDGVEPNYVDIEPRGGTLVLIKSTDIPHEVLDTTKERMAVVGWYNRPVSASDLASMAFGGGTVAVAPQENVMLRTATLAVAAIMVLGGVLSILLQ